MPKNSGKKQSFCYFFTNLYDKSFNRLFYACVAVFVCIAGLQITRSCAFYFDTVEHIHAAWLVSEGKIPFVDFFEHHNPLLWYVLAPLTKLFERNVVIIPIVRTIAVLSYFACIWMVYQISRRIYGKKAAQYSVLLLFCVYGIWRDIANMRPDIFMYLFFLSGLYWFLKYMSDKKLRQLIVSYLCISISFLFLQKAVILGVGFAVATCYFLYKKQISWRDFVLAACCACVPLVCFFGYLWYTQSLGAWFYYNVIFNINLQEYYGDYNNGGVAHLRWLVVVTLLIIVRYYRFSKENLPILLCMITSVLSFSSFSPHPQYFQGYFFLCAILLAPVICQVRCISIIHGLLIVWLVYSFCVLIPGQRQTDKYNESYKTAAYIIDNATPQDIVFDLGSQACNLYNPDGGYYWFGFFNVAIIDTIYNPNKYLDVDRLIKQVKPKFICVSDDIAEFTNDRVAIYHYMWFNQKAHRLLTKARKYRDLLSKLPNLENDFWKVDQEWIKQNYVKNTKFKIYERID